jgi:uncharacterized protein
MMLVRTKISESDIEGAGLGCFAEEFIPAGTCIWRFSPDFDKCFTEKDLQKVSPVEREFLEKYSYRHGGNYFLCVDNGRFFNHSNSPNTWESKEGQATYALIDISPGEEILSDYRNFGCTDDDLVFNFTLK